MSAVDVVAIAYFDNDNNEPMVLDRANDAIGAHTIAPLAGSWCFAVFADLTWIMQRGDALLEIENNTALNGRVEFIQCAIGGMFEINCISRASV